MIISNIIIGQNETTNTIYCSKKDLQNLDHDSKTETLEKTLKKSCIDYPSQEDCLVCCN